MGLPGRKRLYSLPVTIGHKRCPRCKRNLPVEQFPVDRSRPDGRWHSCSDCNQAYWNTRGKRLAAGRKQAEHSARQTRQGLTGLRQYRHRKGLTLFASLPAPRRDIAHRLLNKYLARHRYNLTRQRIALLIACAASNARRVGDNSWARSMLRRKGYVRAERRHEEQATRLGEIRSQSFGEPRVWSGGLDGI
jgi:transposase-like protein